MELDEISRRVDNGEKVGPGDDLPEKYRKAATRLMGIQANSEIMGGFVVRKLAKRAPTHRRKLGYTAKIQDELGHAQLCYRAIDSLGVRSREDLLEELAEGEGSYINLWHYPDVATDWVESAMISFLAAGSAMKRQETLQHSSYEPYANAMKKICYEEGFHVRQGEHILAEFANGSKKQQEALQEALEWYWPRVLQFFGPPNSHSEHTEFLMDVGLKMETNDDLRKNFLNTYIPKLEKYGLELPDTPRIRYDESEDEYDVVLEDLDWDEFDDVIHNEIGVFNTDDYASNRAATQWVRSVLERTEAHASQSTPHAAAD